jgi:AcrR family transcriptional regulator
MSDKRKQIIEASIELFASNGFWNTPTSKITKHAGVSTGTLFNYFASKELLIDEVYVQLKRELTAHVAAGYPENGTVKDRAEHIWFRYIDWGVHHSIRYRLLQQMKLSNMVSDEAQQQSLSEWTFAGSLTLEGIESEIYREISAEYLNQIVFALLECAVSYAIANELSDMPLTKHITRTFDIFWAGVTS